MQPGFFTEAVAIRGSASPHIMRDVLTFGAMATLTCWASHHLEAIFGTPFKLEVGWFELAGAAVSLLLVIRTNGGYDRWWEARKLWGGIVNQCRNLVISALAYGPADARWRERFVRIAACFPHASRAALRGEEIGPPIVALVGPETASRIEAADHGPNAVAHELAVLLKEARRDHRMDGWAFAQIDKERAQLIDHIGGCERILKTPLPRVYSIKIRRLIAFFLATLPFVLLHRVSIEAMIPLITMAVAYPLLSLDRVGSDLQNPFRAGGLAPLPLNDICTTIERNVLALLELETPAQDRTLRRVR